MNPDVEAQTQDDGTTNNPFTRTITIRGDKSKTENKGLQSKGPGTLLRMTRHIVRILLFLAVLSCLVLSKLSFVALAQNFNDTPSTSLEESRVNKAANFWRLLIILMIPGLFSLLRCLWCGLISRTRRNYPWPSKRAILAVSNSIWICCQMFPSRDKLPLTLLSNPELCGLSVL
jgi:magnesium-transporting ATPase (P-type)